MDELTWIYNCAKYILHFRTDIEKAMSELIESIIVCGKRRKYYREQRQDGTIEWTMIYYYEISNEEIDKFNKKICEIKRLPLYKIYRDNINKTISLLNNFVCINSRIVNFIQNKLYIPYNKVIELGGIVSQGESIRNKIIEKYRKFNHFNYDDIKNMEFLIK